jgi:hypothetical protein
VKDCAPTRRHRTASLPPSAAASVATILLDSLSEEKFKDSVGIKPPKLNQLTGWSPWDLRPQAIDDIPMGHYVPLLEFNHIVEIARPSGAKFLREGFDIVVGHHLKAVVRHVGVRMH